MTCKKIQMSRPLVAPAIASFAALFLVSLPAWPAPALGTPGQPQASTSQSSTSAAQPPAPPASQPQAPNVKPGSKEDVNAIGDRGVGKGLDFYSLQREIALGKQLSEEVNKTARFITDPVVTGYVNRVEQNLVRNSDCQVPITTRVIDSDEVNAFALPGGYLYVNSGLILRADEESELAGVLGHETAHVCLRHGTKNATREDLVQIASIPAMIFIPYSWTGLAMYQGMNFGIPLAFLKFSRDEERQADYFGLQYMYKAGYDPNSFVSFFEKVEADELKQPGTVAKIFADHPPTPDRIEAIQNEISTILPPRKEYVVTTSEFDVVKRRLQRIEMNLKVKDSNPNRPTLRRRTASTPGSATPSDEGPPTLKRRPDDDQPLN
ncbi:MAG TPA: M48 family metallopeptidase [Verrucomicrobiae bacterium]|nr:M48 family metallopeptidase [Verrucomicrobiae bacterium]